MSPFWSEGFAKSGAVAKDKESESEITKAEASSPVRLKDISSPSASVTTISKTFIWPFVTSTSSCRSTNTGLLSLRLRIMTLNSGDIVCSDPSEATTFKTYTLSPSESIGSS